MPRRLYVPLPRQGDREYSSLIILVVRIIRGIVAAITTTRCRHQSLRPDGWRVTWKRLDVGGNKFPNAFRSLGPPGAAAAQRCASWKGASPCVWRRLLGGVSSGSCEELTNKVVLDVAKSNKHGVGG